ncbi:MAG: LptE family protein [Alistipes sp.]|nr:LptE family protein [Alistipes sp.]
MRRLFILFCAALSLLTACTVKYSLSGASIPPDAKTFSVAYFPNNAPMVAPILSATLTDELTQRFASRTNLVQVDEGGDFAFEGEIVGYSSTTSSVSSGDYALQNRLSITIKVKFTNAIDDKMSFNKNFSAYADYDSTKLLNEVESELIPQIVEQLVTDIFQASASNW